MTQVCRPGKCIEAIRVALLDQCTLEPVPGPLNGYAMGCIIEPNWTPEIEEGEESIVKDNCGNICLRDDRCDLTKRWNLEFKIKEPDKEFVSLINGDPLIVDETDEENPISIGVRHLSYGACSPYIFLELFENTGACDTEGAVIYYRHVFPAVRLKWTGNEREGVFRILQIEGKTNPVTTDDIGSGPFADIPAGVLVGASATETIDYAWFEDEVLPVVQCGAIEVPTPGFALDQMLIWGTGIDGNSFSFWRSNADGTDQALLNTDESGGTPVLGITQDRLSILANFAQTHWNQYDKDGALLATGTPEFSMGNDSHLALSPDGTLIAYQTVDSVPPTPVSYIRYTDFAGVETDVVSEGVDTGDFDVPAWSPDGTMIAFHVRVNGTDERVRVVLIDGTFVSETANLTLAGGLVTRRPLWAPDSEHIYFPVDNGANTRIIRIDASDGSQTTVVDVPDVSGSPSVKSFDVLPDDSQIIVLQHAGGGPSVEKLGKAPTSGGALTIISTNQAYAENNNDPIALSPDGAFVAILIQENIAYDGQNAVAVFDTSVGVATAPVATFQLPGTQTTNNLKRLEWHSIT